MSSVLVYSQPSDSALVSVSDFQDSWLISLSTSELDFSGAVDGELPDRSFTVYGISEGSVAVKVYANELYDNSTGVVVSENKLSVSPAAFDIVNAESRKINVDFDGTDVDEGTYLGTIVVVATSENGTTTSSKIGVTARISIAPEPFFYSFKNVLIVAILVLSLLGWLYKEEWRGLKQYIVVGVAILVAYIWIYLLLVYGFGDLNTVVAAVLITPYLTYAATYLTEKRTQRSEKEKTSLTVRNEGIKEDINLIRNILGELTTHFASFTPDYYGPDPLPSAKLLFSKGNGELSRKVWDESTKQGMIANITVLEIEKYYEFIELYNKYYSCAMFLTENMSEQAFEELAHTTFFVKFHDFRKKYAELEKVLFVNLSYYLGLFNKTNLSPLSVDYPRVTRTLLQQLVDYEVIDLDKYTFLIKPGIDIDEKKFLKNFEKKYAEEFSDLAKEYKEEFPEKNAVGEEYEDWKKKHKEREKDKERKKEEAKERIEKFHINASDIQKIAIEIYSKENIPIFYREVEADFEKRYLALRAQIKTLLKEAPLPEICTQRKRINPLL